MKTVIQVILLAAIVALSYFLYVSIDTPIQFEKAKEKRFNVTIQRLKDIRSAQLAFKTKFGKFTADFDSLIHFVKTDSLPMVKAIGNIDDSLLLTRTMREAEAYALKKGYIIRDTVNISVLDSLFGQSYPIDSLGIIPFSGGKKFDLAIAEIETGSKVKVKVFEAKALYNDILVGLNHQLLVNLNAEAKKLGKYKGLKVGDIKEPNNNAGNWE